MRKPIKTIFIALLFLGMLQTASAQFLGYVTPQGVIATSVISSSRTGPSSTITNIGQSIHILTYSQSGPTRPMQIRLEGSYDNSTFFAISDDATDTPNGEVVAVGYYPFIRANLTLCQLCLISNTFVTANYSGISSSQTNLLGFYNPSQTIRKVIFNFASNDVGATVTPVSVPYGSTGGYLVFNGSGAALPGGSTITVSANIGNTSTPIATFTPTATGVQAFTVPSTATTSVTVQYSNGGTNGASFSLFYVFTPPGGLPASAQPGATSNSENTAVNATVTTTLTATAIQRGHLFSVNARCSAGTAQLTVKDGATTLWTSATAEVATTSFTRNFTPALASTIGNNLVVTLSTCGAANTGTLDVQASVF